MPAARSGPGAAVRPPVRAAAPPPRVVANPDNQVAPAPRVRANPDNQASPAPRVQANPDNQGFARLSHVLATNSGRPEAAAQAGSSRARPSPRNSSASPAARIASMVLGRLWNGPDVSFMAPLESLGGIGRAAYSTGGRGLRQDELRSLFNQDFASLRTEGLLPKGAKEPPVAFPATGIRGTERSYERNGKVYFSPAVVNAANDPNSLLHSWAQETPIHELAHTLQKPQVIGGSVPLKEGGAQAFSDAALPRVAGPMPTYDTNYSGYVRDVRAKKGPQWFMRGQFR